MALKTLLVKQCTFDNFNTESVWCECKLDCSSYIFGCVYRPPVNDIAYLKNIINSIKYIFHKYINHNIVITGDLNFPNVNWNLDDPHSVNNLDIKFIRCIMDNNLF